METTHTARHPSTAKLGQRLREARLQRNLTQGEVARGQFSVSYISAVERGQIRPSLGALEKLAERLHVPITDLLTESELEQRPIRYGEPHETYAERMTEENEARLREARVLYYQGNIGDAIELLTRTSLQRLNQREIALLHLQLAECYLAREAAEDARREAAQGILVAERVGDDDLTQRLRAALGQAYALLHSPELALDQFRSAISALDTMDESDPSFRLQLLTDAGTQAIVKGEIDQAVSYLQDAASVASDIADPVRLGTTFWAISQAYRARNDASQARYYAIRSLAAFQEGKARSLVTQAYSRLGRALALNSQESEAFESLRVARELATAQHDLRGMAEVDRSLAAVYLQENRPDDALTAAQSALAHAESIGDVEMRADGFLMLARIYTVQDRVAEASSSYEQAIDLLQETSASEKLQSAYEQFSAFLEAHGERERAFDMLKQAYRSGIRSGVTL